MAKKKKTGLAPRAGAVPNLSVCMIARNEERGILVSLDSVRGLVNEVVVAIDPTSTDKTWENVEAWLKEWDPTGDNWVLTQGLSVEEVGFAKARNVALEHVQSEWTLVLDSDERLPDRETLMMPGANGKWAPTEIRAHDMLRITLANLKPEIEMMAVNMIMCDDQGKVQSQFQGERMLKRGLRFERPVHNYVTGGGEKEGVSCSAVSEISIIHTRKLRAPSERFYRAKQRLRMAEKFFKELIEKDPDDTRSLFYLAGAYAESDRPDDAIIWYRKYLAAPNDFPQERYQASVFLSRMLFEKAQNVKEEDQGALYEEARHVAASAVADNFDRAECYYNLAQIAHARDDFKQALFFYETASKCAFKVDPHFVEAATHTWAPYLGKAACQFALGNTEEAEVAVGDARERGATEESIAFLYNFTMPRYKPISHLGVFINVGDDKFVKPLLEHWGRRYQVGLCTEVKGVEEVLTWSDTAFFEFGGELLIAATKLPHQCRMIVRIHGHEIHSGFIPQVNWARVDTVIFVAEYLRDVAVKQAPDMAKHCQLLVIPGGVIWDHYTVAEGKQGNKIAVSGYINPKKNLGKAVEILYEAKKTRPGLELHVCGTIQDSRTWLYLGTLIEELGLRAMECPDGVRPPSESRSCTWCTGRGKCKGEGDDDYWECPECGGSGKIAGGQADVYFYPWQDDLNVWFADKDYILSTSIEESFHYALAQGMAAGLKPLIHCWRSSRDFYKPEWVYRTQDEAVAMLQAQPNAEDRQAYRNYVITDLAFEQQLKAIDIVLARRTVSIPAPDSKEFRFENEVAHAMERMGFAPAGPREADILFCMESAADVINMPQINGQTRIYWNAAQIIGRDKLATRRRRVAQAVAKTDIFTVAGTPAAAKALKTPHVVYQGGARDSWRGNGHVEKTVDVGFYGIPNARRKRFIKTLGGKLRDAGGDRIEALSSYEMRELVPFVERCKIMLNIHWTDHLNTEARVGEVLSTGTFLLTEKLAEGHPFPPGLFIEWETPEDLLKKASYYLKHEKEREEIAQRGRDWIWKNLRVEHQVAKVLERAGVRWVNADPGTN